MYICVNFFWDQSRSLAFISINICLTKCLNTFCSSSIDSLFIHCEIGFFFQKIANQLNRYRLYWTFAIITHHIDLFGILAALQIVGGELLFLQSLDLKKKKMAISLMPTLFLQQHIKQSVAHLTFWMKRHWEFCKTSFSQ